MLKNFLLNILRKILFLLDTPKFREVTGEENPVVLGRNANALLKNPVFDYITKQIETDLINAIKTSAPKDKEAREHIYYRLEGLSHIKAALLGAVANMRIEEKRKEKK